MLQIKYSFRKATAKDTRVVLTCENDNKFPAILKRLGIDPAIILARGFKGKKDEVIEFWAPSPSGGNLILLGLGSDENPDNARRAGGILGAIAVKKKLSSLAVVWVPDMKKYLPAFVEGIILGGYTFDRYKSSADDPAEIKLIFDNSAAAFKGEIDRAIIICEAVRLARDLINTPGNDLPPRELAARAKKLALSCGMPVKIYGPAELARLNMGALLGVARGSDQPPQLVEWRYNGAGKKDKPIVLIGKGVTFDSGGISIKPAEGMQEMKNDMAGAAVVISLMHILARLKPRLNVIGLAPCVENMPSGKALRPGDIVTASDGQTIEIISTDAEGRLILADAICHARKLNPAALIDMATLTGAVRIALGDTTAGILGNDDKMIDRLYQSGQRTAEKVWRLPLWEEYHELIKSDVADMKNSGGRPGGTITAACFLAKFVKDTPWAHIDIASVDNNDKSHPYLTKGATGFGVRLLADYLLGLD